MCDNPYALRNHYSGQAPAVLRYRYRFREAANEADLADLREWWIDTLAVRRVCLAESYTRWLASYLIAAPGGVGLAAYLLLIAQSLTAAVVVLLLVGVAHLLLWVLPPRLVHIDTHGLWVTRQLTTGHVPFTTLRTIEHDASTNRVRLVFKLGTFPTVTTHHFRVQRLKPSALGHGFAAMDESTWTLKAKPAGLTAYELSHLLRWALEAYGNPDTTPQVLIKDPHEPPSEPINDDEFDDQTRMED